jgi:hypothetical protein
MSGISEPQTRARIRDPRLDFFRGIGMFIILVAHVPWNGLTDFIPARFGFSDAADMFVFCSGMASAIAFGRVFDQHGWGVGSLRILVRLWQIYWAHICSFLAVMAFMIAADQWLGVDHYVREELNLQSVLDEPRQHLLGLMTLRFLPNYFDILPMYLAILAMVPVVMALASANRWLVGLAVLASWTLAQTAWLDLSADAETRRGWFFNPFAWQLVFFTGFAFARHWLPTPPRRGWLVWASIAIVVLAIPVGCQSGFSCHAGFGHIPVLGEIHDSLGWLIGKTNFGPLRYLHFLATAHLAWIAVGERGARLVGPVADAFRQVGQQTLAVFLAGLVIAQALGVILDIIGRGIAPTLLVNAIGFAALFAVARIAAFAKAPPWSKHAPRALAPPTRHFVSEAVPAPDSARLHERHDPETIN